MVARLQDKKADLLERVVDRLHDKLPDPQAETRRGVPRATTTARCRRPSCSSAIRSISTARRSPICASPSSARPGQAKVRVYNPQIEQHGWQSTHTVVEVVTDDMPFLVDSVSMALNRPWAC